jgi:hypothetical protein
MKIFVWITIIISYLFILLAVLPIRLFLVQTTITNKLDKEIFVTPFGRVRSTTTATIPLEFKFPGISNPFNKKISVKSYETIKLYHDNDACMLDGLLINKGDTLFKVGNDKQADNLYSISNAVLNDNTGKTFDDFTKYNIADFSGFTFQILLLLYAPIMTVIILTRKLKK